MAFKILLLEDAQSDIETFQMTVDRMNDAQNANAFELDVANTIDSATRFLASQEYNGCVVDIKLNGEDGNNFILGVMDSYRIPVIVFSATPDVESNVKCFIKSEKTPEDVINELQAENRTGLFNVLGGKGIIEKNINDIFWNALYPKVDVWKKYCDRGMRTEEILLRYTVAYLQERLDDGPAYCTEEMYIIGNQNPYKTGSIFVEKTNDIDYVLLSPPCDLAVHGEGFKSDSLLLCEIEKIPENWNGLTKKQIEKKIKNNENEYSHWLADNSLYRGGFINFRKLVTCTKEELESSYKYREIKVQDQFVKSILNRFSAYYARQGQPDFDFKIEAESRSV